MMDSIYTANKYGAPISHVGWQNVQRMLEWLGKEVLVLLCRQGASSVFASLLAPNTVCARAFSDQSPGQQRFPGNRRGFIRTNR
jgi:hypothetical protein